MTRYPVELNVKDEPIAVVGGGAVAARKVRGLVEAGARVRVISPAFTAELEDRDDIERVTEPYRPEFIEPARLVFACTDDRALNRRVCADARNLGLWCNVADDPRASDFVVPAVLRRGSLTVAVGTDGTAPRLAAHLRDELASQLGPEYAILVEEWARARRIIQDRIGDAQTRQAAMDALSQAWASESYPLHDRQTWRNRFDQVISRWAPSAASD